MIHTKFRGNQLFLGQGQPNVIIYTNFVELESLMLNAKFQDHRFWRRFLRFLPYIGMAAILVM